MDSLFFGPDVEARFWAKVACGDAGDCWPFLGGKTGSGYGWFTTGGRDDLRLNAHIFAFWSAKGPVPAGLVVRHTCDNPPCCNPNHLVAGTHQENADDRRFRGRAGALQRDAHPRAKLSRDDAEFVKRSPLKGTVLAARFGVSKSTISMIRQPDEMRVASLMRQRERRRAARAH